VDQHSGRAWSFFSGEKTGFTDVLKIELERLKALGFAVKTLRMDNAGEWQAHVAPMCKSLGITPEFTAPHTPQFNAKVEREYPTIRNMAAACMTASDFSRSEQMLLWAHAVDDCTILRNLQPRGDYANAYEAFNEQPPVKTKDLIPWGAKGWMTKRDKIKPKWKPKATRVRRVGYAKNHSSDTYLVLKDDTKKFVESRDIKWDEPRRFRKLSLEKTRPDPKQTVIATRFEPPLVSDDDSEEDSEEDDGPPAAAAPPVPTGRLSSELRRLATSYNTGAVLPRTRQQTARAIVNNVAVLERDPANDREAMNCSEKEQWWDGLKNEYDGFFAIKTWKILKAHEAKLGAGNKPLTTKNVYKKKLHAITKEPRYRVRNCLRGFEMIPGVHFDESYAPTPMSASVRLVLAISLSILTELCPESKLTWEELLDWIEEEEWIVGDLFDVVQAFLTSDLDPEKNPVFIRLPPMWKEYCAERGIPYDPTDLIQLLKSQYGSVDSAKRWMDKFTAMVTEPGGIEMKQSKIDPCVYYKHDAGGNLILLMAIHIDDGYVCGKPSEVKKLMAHLKKTVDILEIGRIDTHLGVNYSLRKDELGWYYECDMRKYVMDTVADFEKTTGTTLKNQRSPGAPGELLLKLAEDEEVIDIGNYRKFTGRILYAVTKVLPDCANAVRDLTCHMSAPGSEHWSAMARLFGYLKYNYRPMKLRAPTELRVIAQFDADWGTDKNDRRSISSILTTIGGTALTNFASKKQQTVSLSSCEAETMASTMCAQDVLFTMNLLTELIGDKLLLPSYVYGDNVASLFLAQNNSVGQRTKHIDIRHRFMHELTLGGDERKVELRLNPSEENTSDINSKNTKIETHERLSAKLYEGLVIAEVNPSKEDVESKEDDQKPKVDGNTKSDRGQT
jgi:hypothetical protein